MNHFATPDFWYCYRHLPEHVRELADKNSEGFRALVDKINATNDFFIRTSDPEHGRVVQEVVQRIHDNGHVFKGTYEGYYCPRCADFKTEAELVDGNKCPIHLIELEWEKEDNWFFRLSAFQEPLERLYAERPEWVTPRNRYNEALSFIKQGLNDISLSRARLRWGVPVLESAITLVADGRLHYRGHDAIALAHTRSLGEVASLIWTGSFDGMPADALARRSSTPRNL